MLLIKDLLEISFRFLVARHLLISQTQGLLCSFSISKLQHGLWITFSALPYHPADTDCCLCSRAGRRVVCLYSSKITKIVLMQIHLHWWCQLVCFSVNLIPRPCLILLTLLYCYLQQLLELWLWGVNNTIQQKALHSNYISRERPPLFISILRRTQSFEKYACHPLSPRRISISDRNSCINSFS